MHIVHMLWNCLAPYFISIVNIIEPVNVNIRHSFCTIIGLTIENRHVCHECKRHMSVSNQ